jgi:hypothetical protein
LLINLYYAKDLLSHDCWDYDIFTLKYKIYLYVAYIHDYWHFSRGWYHRISLIFWGWHTKPKRTCYLFEYLFDYLIYSSLASTMNIKGQTHSTPWHPTCLFSCLFMAWMIQVIFTATNLYPSTIITKYLKILWIMASNKIYCSYMTRDY